MYTLMEVDYSLALVKSDQRRVCCSVASAPINGTQVIYIPTSAVIRINTDAQHSRTMFLLKFQRHQLFQRQKTFTRRFRAAISEN